MSELYISEFKGKDLLSGNQWSLYNKLKTLIKSKKLKEELKDIENIIKKYHSDYNKEDIKNLAREINQTGCTLVAAVANILDSLNYDNEKVKEIFGFSLYDNDRNIKHDYLIAELASFFKDKVEIEIRGVHKILEFGSNIEAAKKILGIDCKTETEAFIKLTENNCLIDGHVYKYFEKNPATYMNDYHEIGKEIFNKDFNSLEELKKAFEDNNMVVNIKGVSIPEKLSTLDDYSYVKWLDYYFKGKDLDFRVFSEKNRFNSYEEAISALEMFKEKGESITVEVDPSSEVAMTDGSKFGWFNFSNVVGVGHAMPFKGINVNGDIVVSSWGEYHVIPKEYIKDLWFYNRSIYEINKNKTESEQLFSNDEKFDSSKNIYYQLLNSINQKIEYLNSLNNLKNMEIIYEIFTEEELKLLSFEEVLYKNNDGNISPTILIIINLLDQFDYRILQNNGKFIQVSKDYLQVLIDTGQLINTGNIPGFEEFNRK